MFAKKRSDRPVVDDADADDGLSLPLRHGYGTCGRQRGSHEPESQGTLCQDDADGKGEQQRLLALLLARLLALRVLLQL